MSGVIDEAVRLLSSLTLTTERGVSVRGERVHVIVDPEWDESTQRFNVSLLCHAPAIGQPDWRGLPVLFEQLGAFAAPVFARATLASSSTANATFNGRGGRQTTTSTRATSAVSAAQSTRSEVIAIARLDQRGHAVLRDLPAGEYRLVAAALWVEHRGPVVVPMKLTSADRRLTVSMEPDSPGRVRVTAEVADATLATATARCSFLDRDNRVVQGGTIELAPTTSGESHAGRWEGRVALEATGGFTCQVLRNDDQPGATI